MKQVQDNRFKSIAISLVVIGIIATSPLTWAKEETLQQDQVTQEKSTSLAEIKKTVMTATGYDSVSLDLTGNNNQLTVTLVNSQKATLSAREEDALKIVSTITAAIASKPEFKALQTLHINYMTRTSIQTKARLIDAIDFIKNPQGNFIHHKT